MNALHIDEVNAGERFEFGANWMSFLNGMNDERIDRAAESLQSKLGIDTLDGLRFLDAGSGSGLFSLAARRLGATVYSIDYDPESIACTQTLKQRYYPNDKNWDIEEGSVLDTEFLEKLGTFDIVYSWGVLHHTGAMWKALSNVSGLVNSDGYLFISIYNDQGGQSRRWAMLKRIYNKLPAVFRQPYVIATMGPREVRLFLSQLLRGSPGNYFGNIRNYSKRSMRGMRYWHDMVDWIGGYPFEVARPEQIFEFYKKRGFDLRTLKTQGGGLGCNEFVFYRLHA